VLYAGHCFADLFGTKGDDAETAGEALGIVVEYMRCYFEGMAKRGKQKPRRRR
jgi:hypothetical protein